MPRPVFTETMQVGSLVRDLDAALRRYVDDYGLGPWNIYKFNPNKLIVDRIWQNRPSVKARLPLHSPRDLQEWRRIR